MKITKPPSQHSMLSHHLPASETPFQWWRADDDPIKAVLGSSVPLSAKKNIKFGPFWIRAWKYSLLLPPLVHVYVQNIIIYKRITKYQAWIQRGILRSGHPPHTLENHKTVGFLRNTGMVPQPTWKITKLPNQYHISVWPSSALCWRADGDHLCLLGLGFFGILVQGPSLSKSAPDYLGSLWHSERMYTF